MISPYDRCPRCGGGYYKGERNADAYLHMSCKPCMFKYFIDTTTARRFQLTLNDNGVFYTVFWLCESWPHRCAITRDANLHITFDEWLPFDISLEQVKTYITFQ